MANTWTSIGKYLGRKFQINLKCPCLACCNSVFFTSIRTRNSTLNMKSYGNSFDGILEDWPFHQYIHLNFKLCIFLNCHWIFSETCSCAQISSQIYEEHIEISSKKHLRTVLSVSFSAGMFVSQFFISLPRKGKRRMCTCQHNLVVSPKTFFLIWKNFLTFFDFQKFSNILNDQVKLLHFTYKKRICWYSSTGS